MKYNILLNQFKIFIFSHVILSNVEITKEKVVVNYLIIYCATLPNLFKKITFLIYNSSTSWIYHTT